MKPRYTLTNFRGSRSLLDALYVALVVVADYHKSRVGSTNVLKSLMLTRLAKKTKQPDIQVATER